MDYRYPRFDRHHVLSDLRGFTGGPTPGEDMPDFDLPTLDGTRLRRTDFVGKRPLVLVTGSYTCPMTHSAGPLLDELHAEFGRDVSFAMLYTRELHPGENYPQPTTIERKTEHARAYRDRDHVAFTVAVDDLDGTLHRALDAKANSVYVMGIDGKVAYRALWAGDRIGTLRSALSGLVAGKPPRQSQGQVVALLRGMGATWEILRLAGRQAVTDTLVAMPPAVIVAATARLFRPLSDLGRGIAGAGAVGLASLAVVAAIATAIR